MASCRSISQGFLLRNSKNSCTPMSTKLWKLWHSCSNAPKCSQPRTANRATAHSLMRKSSQNRTGHLHSPSQMKPQLFPHGEQLSPSLIIRGTSNSDTWCISETKVSEQNSTLYATVRSLLHTRALLQSILQTSGTERRMPGLVFMWYKASVENKHQ